ncbi:MAG: hypothetical protein R2864_04180 [Syntrophotaleaceae bacterium]
MSRRRGGIVGYESLIRGPSNSPLHSPVNLFSVASRCGRLFELDLLCREVNIRSFAHQGLSIVSQCKSQLSDRAGLSGWFYPPVSPPVRPQPAAGGD